MKWKRHVVVVSLRHYVSMGVRHRRLYGSWHVCFVPSVLILRSRKAVFLWHRPQSLRGTCLRINVDPRQMAFSVMITVTDREREQLIIIVDRLLRWIIRKTPVIVIYSRNCSNSRDNRILKPVTVIEISVSKSFL